MKAKGKTSYGMIGIWINIEETTWDTYIEESIGNEGEEEKLEICTFQC